MTVILSREDEKRLMEAVNMIKSMKLPKSHVVNGVNEEVNIVIYLNNEMDLNKRNDNLMKSLRARGVKV